MVVWCTQNAPRWQQFFGGTSHASAVSTPLRWIYPPPKKTRYKKLFTHVESHASAVSLLESGEQRYIKAINNNIKQSETWVNILFVNENTHLTATGREIKH